MVGRQWLSIGIWAVAGLLIGGGVVIAASTVDQFTSTNAFCTSCHDMASMANDPHFLQSVHRSNAAGVLPSCGDCHLPASNIVAATYAHMTEGVRDLVAEWTHNYNDPTNWEKRRIELADYVRLKMRANDSQACRNCHDPAAIHPASQRGQAAHALLATGSVTCIDCHFNLVHAPVPPSIDFIRGSGLGGKKEK